MGFGYALFTDGKQIRKLINYIMQLNTSSYYPETGLATARESSLICDDYDNDLSLEIPFSSINTGTFEEEMQLEEEEKIISPLVLYEYGADNDFEFDRALLINRAARYILKTEKKYINNIYGVYNIENQKTVIKYSDDKTNEEIAEIFPSVNVGEDDVPIGSVKEKYTVNILSRNTALLEKISMESVQQIEKNIKLIS